MAVRYLPDEAQIQVLQTRVAIGLASLPRAAIAKLCRAVSHPCDLGQASFLV